MTQDPDASTLIAQPPRPGSNLPEVSVGDLARAIKRTIEGYGVVRVRGEISQPKKHSSGHCYLRLKDETAVIEAVIWRGALAKLAVAPEDGLEVVVQGRLTTYPGRSQYQLVIETMELAGEGALLKMLEERKRRLAAEGLFAPDRKKPIPFLPEVIGVVTSPTGAVIRDILHRLADRFPRRVLLWPVAVQGEGAAAQVAAAIAGFNALAPGGAVPRPDVLIVARGGGSLEDLMPFNEEIVVRAAAASVIPLISAVGHETDTTLIDHAADLRAPTPTAAAEMAVPVRAELLVRTLDAARRMAAAANRRLTEERTRVEGLARGLGDPRSLIETRAQRLDDRAERLELAIRAAIEKRRGRLGEMSLPHPRERLGAAAGRLALAAQALGGALRQSVTVAEGRFGRVASRLSLRPVTLRIGEGERRYADLAPRIDRAFAKSLEEKAARLDTVSKLLVSYSYEGVLQRGYALVRSGDAPVMDAASASPGGRVTLVFHDGEVGATLDGVRAKPERAKPKAAPDQGTLF